MDSDRVFEHAVFAVYSSVCVACLVSVLLAFGSYFDRHILFGHGIMDGK
jgi:hypothetical protein